MRTREVFPDGAGNRPVDRAGAPGRQPGGIAGRVIDRYELRERIGAGGMGEVYRARDTLLQRDVALKIIRGDLNAAGPGRSRLLREARMAATLNHPNICVVHDVGEAGEVPFVTMELLRGETLRAMLTRGRRIAVDQGLRVAQGVAAALAEAHRRGIVHRDIKPENIMVLPDGRVKVLDFGLAKPLAADWLRGPAADPDPGGGIPADRALPGDDATSADRTTTTDRGLTAASTIGTPGAAGDPATGPAFHESPTEAITDATLTTPGTILGTYHYLSPEQADCRPADARSDVFSLGIVLYEMLSGERPFGGPTLQSLLEAIRREDPAPLTTRRLRLPAPLVAIVERCLRKDPRDRFQQAAELAAAIDGVALALRRAATRRQVAVLVSLAALPATITLGWWLARVRPALRDAESRMVMPQVRRLSFTGSATVPSFSPDGASIAFRQVVDGKVAVAVMPAGGGRTRILTAEGGSFVSLEWSPDGDAVLGGYEKDWGSAWELPLAGGEPRLVLKNAEFASFTADGQRATFDRPGAHEVRDIWVRDMEAGSERVLYAAVPDRENCYKPRWAPDGRRIAFHCFDRVEGRTYMYQFDVETGERLPIALPELTPIGLYGWLPDGRHIVTGALRGRRANIWIVPAPGVPDKPRQLTMGVEQEMHVSVGAGGRTIAFTRISRQTDIVFLDPATGDRRRTATGLTTGERPSFWRDGEGLFVTEVRDGAGTIVSHSLTDGMSTAISPEAGMFCDRPLALPHDTAAFVCESAIPQGQGGVYDPGEWARTVYKAGVGSPPVALFSESGAIELLAASPSGNRLVYRFEKNPPLAVLRMYDIRTGRSEDLLEEPGGEFFPAAVWTGEEDGLLLVHALEDEDPATPTTVRIERLALDTRAITVDQTFRAKLESSALSPDGKQLAYTDHAADEHAPAQDRAVFIRPVRGPGRPRRLSLGQADHHPRHLAWSADGRTLAVEQIKQTHDIYTVENPWATP